MPPRAPLQVQRPGRASAPSPVGPAPADEFRRPADEAAPEPPAATEPAWKRPLDLCCILLSLPLVLPVMILVLIWIRLVSPGPALFRQERVGRDGKRFMLYKFRSMKVDADHRCHETHLRHLVESDRPMIKMDLLCDSRLIFGGCLLRAAGLDELPQLLNVIRGEMSLVGPRPCLPQEYLFFSIKQRERFKLLPGLTGSWQVSGKNRSTFNEMILMDVNYVRQASVSLDLKIMLQTPAVLIQQLRETARHHRAGSQFGWQHARGSPAHKG